MKSQSNSIRCFLSLAAAACWSLTALTASAQATQTYTGGDGGTWDSGVTPDWDGGSVWTDGNNANFNTTGTVNVTTPVTASFIDINTGGNVTLSGSDPITITTGNGVLNNEFNGTTTITDPIQLDTSIDGDRFDVSDIDGAGTINLGPISFVGSVARPSGRAVIFNGGTNSNFILNGLAGTSVNVARVVLDGGTMTLQGDYTVNTNSQLVEDDFGTVIIASSNIGTGSINMGGNSFTVATTLTKGAQTFNGSINGQNIFDPGAPDQNFGFVTVGGSTADNSTYNGPINTVVTGLTVTAAANGRVNFNGVLGNSNVTGLIKTGAGTTVLSAANTYGIFNGFNGQTAPFAADIQQGTMLITNTAGTAFGNNTGNVQVEAGATLGGSGISTQTVVAMSASSIIAPGDAGQANLGIAPTTGTLTLAGGLDTSNGGATLDFKINGLDNDKLSFASGDFVPTGTLTINLFNMGSQDSILSNHYYTLIDPSAGTLDPSGATVNVVAPYGYAVEDVQFGTFTGLEVELIAAPEPSTYALMLSGLGFLAFCLRRKSRA